MLMAALLVIPVLVIEQSPHASHGMRVLGAVLNWAIWLTFASELVGLMFIGIGFVALLTGAIAERFVAPRLEAAEQDLAGDVEIAETDLLAELHAVAERLARVEAALERRGRSDAEGQGPRKT